jgi:RimJ/RimL family protein N-acetyltransferase
VKALADRAADFNLTNLFVRVLPDNLPAIHCYESAGFTQVSSTDQADYNTGQPRRYLWLKWASPSNAPRRIAPP